MGHLDEGAMVTDANFLSLVAHELRNPIAIIKGLAQTISLSRNRLSEDEIDECLSRLIRQTDRLGHLVDDLVAASQSSGERLQVVLESFELREPINGAIESVPQPAGRRLDVDVPPGLAVRADAFRLEQVFSNLLDNAYRYGGSQIRLQARRDKGDRVMVTLSDDGNGVPPELVPSLFDRLSRGTNATNTRGLGLGLAIAREVVVACGGDIWYEPNEPQGARFRTLLQWAGAPHQDVVAALSSERLGDPMANILIVDDEPDLRFLHKIIFREAGHEVAVASDGAAALERVKQDLPDLIVTDIMMPVMDGNQLIRSLRSDPETASIPIIAVSANPAMVEGADAILPKGSGTARILEAASSLIHSERP
jgi:two-component system, sensor histidine kinase